MALESHPGQAHARANKFKEVELVSATELDKSPTDAEIIEDFPDPD